MEGTKSVTRPEEVNADETSCARAAEMPPRSFSHAGGGVAEVREVARKARVSVLKDMVVLCALPEIWY